MASTGTSTDTDSGTLMVLGDDVIKAEHHKGLRANWLLIITIFIICLLLLIIITSTICFKKHHDQKKLANSQEQIVIENGKKQPEFVRMISKMSYGKVSMHPIFDEYGSPNTSASGSLVAFSGDFVEPEEKANENLIEEASGDQVDEMKWDHEISFRFEPGNLSMFGQNFNFEHDKSDVLSMHSKKHIREKLVSSHKEMFGEKPSTTVKFPTEANNHPELDDLEFPDCKEKKKY